LDKEELKRTGIVKTRVERQVQGGNNKLREEQIDATTRRNTEQRTEKHIIRHVRKHLNTTYRPAARSRPAAGSPAGDHHRLDWLATVVLKCLQTLTTSETTLGSTTVATLGTSIASLTTVTTLATVATLGTGVAALGTTVAALGITALATVATAVATVTAAVCTVRNRLTIESLRTARAVATTVTSASGLRVGHVDADTTAVELLLVHGLDSGLGLSLGAVGLTNVS
jgi:hypothetical protein